MNTRVIEPGWLKHARSNFGGHRPVQPIDFFHEAGICERWGVPEQRNRTARS